MINVDRALRTQSIKDIKSILDHSKLLCLFGNLLCFLQFTLAIQKSLQCFQ